MVFSHQPRVQFAASNPVTCSDLMQLCANESEVCLFLMKSGLLGNYGGECKQCSDGRVSLVKNKGSFSWRCSRKKCRKNISIKAGSFFSRSHLDYSTILLILHGWIYDIPQKYVQEDLRISSPHTIVDWYNFCLEVCHNTLLEDNVKIGGKGHVVEVDESKFQKSRSRKGSQADGSWILGAIDRETKETFFQVVPDRSVETLLPILIENILPESIVISDCWKEYHSLSQHFKKHLNINHSLRFVDPSDKKNCTNAVDGTWHFMKRNRSGTMKSRYNTDFSLYCMKEKYLTDIKCPFEAFLELIKRSYPLEKVISMPKSLDPGCSETPKKRDVDAQNKQPVPSKTKRRKIKLVNLSDCCDFEKGEKSDHPYSPDFVPSVFAHTTLEEKRKGIEALAAFEARKKEKVQEEQNPARCIILHPEEESQVNEEGLDEDDDDDGPVKDTETELFGEDSSALTTGFNNVQKEKWELKQPKIFSFDKGSFEGGPFGNERVEYFTGLPSLSVLTAVLNFLLPYISKTRALSPFQQLLVVLMRLRLNLDSEFLGMCFGISQQSIDKLVLEMIDVCYHRLVPALIIWPEREQLLQTLPSIFCQSYNNCVCIIDCFEILIKKPENHKACAQTYSSNKNHNTIKYFAAITPQGTVSLVSKGWGGCTSDKFVTANSVFLPHLQPGDLVLADCDFGVKALIAARGAELRIPAPSKKLDSSDNEELASIRTYIERVIERVRTNYSILESTIPISLLMTEDSRLTTLDKIVHVCCALTNICKSIVPTE